MPQLWLEIELCDPRTSRQQSIPAVPMIACTCGLSRAISSMIAFRVSTAGRMPRARNRPKSAVTTIRTKSALFGSWQSSV